MAQLNYLNTYRRRPMPVDDMQEGGGFSRQSNQYMARRMNM